MKLRIGKEGKVRVGYELDAQLMHRVRILAAELDVNQSNVSEAAIRDFLHKQGTPTCLTADPSLAARDL